ncbi:uncharacterized protein PV09_06458 [Verruconis gallopava]|uniref:Uncharacterized protein n=1 Tax=Verruconis gallopava TaxID=253628 RepID=A0A0D1XJ36_9PEZI|nr:uncharacterized protein PV09_06458 [Verruconis gallopava]KIW02311.1 hypothetical protein PV09_06458 [Verruconis gallopava]
MITAFGRGGETWANSSARHTYRSTNPSCSVVQRVADQFQGVTSTSKGENMKTMHGRSQGSLEPCFLCVFVRESQSEQREPLGKNELGSYVLQGTNGSIQDELVE